MIIDSKAALYSKLDTMLGLYRATEVPQSAQLDITYRCDLDCVHCYLDEKNEWPELTTKEWLSVLDQLAEMGVWEVGWSGGEVFARPDFDQMLEYAHKLGFRSRVKTHAGNVDEAMARKLESLRVWRVDVSVYSLDADVHDGITGVPGSLEATLAGVAALLKTSIKIRVAVTVFQSNLYELEDINDYFLDLGVDAVFSTNMFPDQSATNALDALQLSGPDLLDADRRILQLRMKKYDEEELLPKRFEQKNDVCGAGRTLVYIAPDGAVWPCVQFPMALGQLREAPLAEIWHKSEERKKLQAFKNADRGACQSCSGASMCFYCPGEAYRRTGDYKTAPDIFHMRTHARMISHDAEGVVPMTEADFATLPDYQTEVLTAKKRNFIFPIYRPTKAGDGARVDQLVSKHEP